MRLKALLIQRKALLIIGAGEEQKLVVKKAKEMGIFVIVSDMNLNAPAVKLADDFILASTYHPDETVKAVLKYRKKRKIDGVIAVGIDAPLTVSMVAKNINSNSHSIKTARIATNKLLMKKVFKKNNIATSWFADVKNINQLKKIISKNINKKFVIKPQDSRGGRGVIQLDKASSIKWAFNNSIQNSPTKKVMIEEYLPGPQLSTESFIYKGNVYTPGLIDRNYEFIDKFAPYFIENGGEQPTKLSKKLILNVNQLIKKVAFAMGVREGIIKGDIVIHNGTPKIIEVAARLSGGYMATMQIPQATGVDLVKIAIKSALSESVNHEELMPKFEKGMAIRYWFPKPGRVLKIEGIANLDKYPWIKYYNILVKKGGIVTKPTDLTKRIGFVICEGKDRQEAIKRAKLAIKLVKITTVK